MKYYFPAKQNYINILNTTALIVNVNTLTKNENGQLLIDETFKYNDNGYIPDWQFMENYINSLPYGDRI